MAVTVQQIVETQLRVIDEALGPLRKIADQADKTARGLAHAGAAGAKGGKAAAGMFGNLFDTLTNMAGIGAVVGGALSLHAAVETSEKYMRNLKEVTELTEGSVSQTDFLFSSARKAGVEYDTMAKTIFRLSRRGAMMESTLAAAGNKVPGMAKKFKRLGVDVTKGPIASLEAMSAAVKAGKIGAGELMGQFGIPQKAANDMQEFLKKLDPKQLEAAKKGGKGLIGNAEMDAFKRIESAQHRIADAWNRIKLTVITKLYPIVADMAEKFAGRLEEFLPKLESAMGWVADHMDQIVTAAKVFVAVMTAKKMLNMVADLASPEGLIGKLGAKGIGGLVGGGLGGLGTQVSGIVSAFMAAGPALLIIAVAIGAIYLAFKAIESNFGGIKDRLIDLWDSIVARFELIGESLGAIWAQVAAIFGVDSPFLEFIGRVTALQFEGLVRVIDGLLLVVLAVTMTISDFAAMAGNVFKNFGPAFKAGVVDPLILYLQSIGKLVAALVQGNVFGMASASKEFAAASAASGKAALKPLGMLLNAPAEVVTTFAKNMAKAQDMTTDRIAKNRADAEAAAAKKAAERNAPDKGPPGNNWDFRGSRFDITQQFAEGFDPDRIAVAFANDLASLGEMQAQSSAVMPSMAR